jgi:diguanylate cyclase (GGDEF)-like protein
MSVIMFDVDHFKRINDTWGHAAGDLVLQRVAHACRVSLRPGDLLGRIGGEEFLVVARDASAEGAAGLAERLRSAVESTRFSDIDSSLVVTISLGVASSENFTSFEKLMQRADALLYEAKEGGRNRVARG